MLDVVLARSCTQDDPRSQCGARVPRLARALPEKARRCQAESNATPMIWRASGSKARNSFQRSGTAIIVNRSGSGVATLELPSRWISGGFGSLIDRGFGQFGQRLVGRLFLIQGRVKKLNRLIQPQFAGPGL